MKFATNFWPCTNSYLPKFSLLRMQVRRTMLQVTNLTTFTGRKQCLATRSRVSMSPVALKSDSRMMT